MPDEVVAIILTAIIAGTIMILSIARMISKAITSKQQTKALSEGGGSSLTQSELEKMLERVVASAQEPIVERLDMIEMMLLKQPALLEGKAEAPLTFPDVEEEDAAVPARKEASA
ncbi:MAG: hypothetical protein AAF730_02850 [Bacteroidota bacterium]